MTQTEFLTKEAIMDECGLDENEFDDILRGSAESDSSMGDNGRREDVQVR